MKPPAVTIGKNAAVFSNTFAILLVVSAVLLIQTTYGGGQVYVPPNARCYSPYIGHNRYKRLHPISTNTGVSARGWQQCVCQCAAHKYFSTMFTVNALAIPGVSSKQNCFCTNEWPPENKALQNARCKRSDWVFFNLRSHPNLKNRCNGINVKPAPKPRPSPAPKYKKPARHKKRRPARKRRKNSKKKHKKKRKSKSKKKVLSKKKTKTKQKNRNKAKLKKKTTAKPKKEAKTKPEEKSTAKPQRKTTARHKKETKAKPQKITKPKTKKNSEKSEESKHKPLKVGEHKQIYNPMLSTTTVEQFPEVHYISMPQFPHGQGYSYICEDCAESGLSSSEQMAAVLVYPHVETEHVIEAGIVPVDFNELHYQYYELDPEETHETQFSLQ